MLCQKEEMMNNSLQSTETPLQKSIEWIFEEEFLLYSS